MMNNSILFCQLLLSLCAKKLVGKVQCTQRRAAVGLVGFYHKTYTHISHPHNKYTCGSKIQKSAI